jgi:hypothetical protein
MAKFGPRRLYRPGELGVVPRGEAGAFIAERNTAPGVPGTARRAVVRETSALAP